MVAPLRQLALGLQNAHRVHQVSSPVSLNLPSQFLNVFVRDRGTVDAATSDLPQQV